MVAFTSNGHKLGGTSTNVPSHKKGGDTYDVD